MVLTTFENEIVPRKLIWEKSYSCYYFLQKHNYCNNPLKLQITTRLNGTTAKRLLRISLQKVIFEIQSYFFAGLQKQPVCTTSRLTTTRDNVTLAAISENSSGISVNSTLQSPTQPRTSVCLHSVLGFRRFRRKLALLRLQLSKNFFTGMVSMAYKSKVPILI